MRSGAVGILDVSIYISLDKELVKRQDRIVFNVKIGDMKISAKTKDDFVENLKTKLHITFPDKIALENSTQLFDDLKGIFLTSKL